MQVSEGLGAPEGVEDDARGGGGALDYRIQALPAIPLPGTIAGPALTCETGPADVLAAVAALDLAEPGDVLLIATGGWTGTASIGDLFAAAARNAGTVAATSYGSAKGASAGTATDAAPGTTAARTAATAASTPDQPAQWWLTPRRQFP